MQKNKQKKPHALWFVTALVLLLALSAPSALAAPTPVPFVDEESGAQFSPPEGWEIVYDSLEDEGETPPGRYLLLAPPQGDNLAAFIVTDVFVFLENTGEGRPRAELNMEYFTSTQGASLLRYYTSGEGEEPPTPKEQHYGRYDFLLCESTSYDAEYDEYQSYLQLLHLSEGRLYDFSYMGETGGKDYSDYLRMVSSLKLGADAGSQASPGAAASITQSLGEGLTGSDTILALFDGGEGMPLVLLFVLSVVVSGALNILPLLVYRYGIKKAPLPHKRAVLIASIYTVSLHVLLRLLQSFVTGQFEWNVLGLAFWIAISTAILASGKRSARLEDVMTAGGPASRASKAAENISEQVHHKGAELFQKTRDLFDDSALFGENRNQAANTVQRDGKFDNRYDDDGYAFQIQEKAAAPSYAAARPSGDAQVDADGYTHFESAGETQQSPLTTEDEGIDPYGRYATSEEQRDYYRSAPPLYHGGSGDLRAPDRYGDYTPGEYGKASGDEACRYCGKMMKRDARVCPHCGARFL